VTLNEYQDEASKTAFASPNVFMRNAEGEFIPAPYLYDGLGLGEAGEVQNKLKKIMRDNNGVITDAMREAVKGELGGLLWYASQVAKDLGIPFDDVAVYNINQLRDRQARGTLKGSGDNR
jgi:hypothetical protein